MEKPSIPKGTRDFGPAAMGRRQYIFDHIRQVFKKYGFQPLETPSMENLSTLTGKYGEEGDQLLFKILNSGDFLKDADPTTLAGKDSKKITSTISEKGLRYDLTVPFARYVVMNRHEIAFPFKRYQIQPVWRADRPQKGRYREFYQCDADVVGTDSLLCEAEIILIIREVFSALNISDYTIKINHRGILSGLAALVGAAEKESSLFVAIDKLDKIGEEKVKEELHARGIETAGTTLLFEILNFKGTTSEKIDLLSSKFATSVIGQKGLTEIKQIVDFLKGFGKSDDHLQFDISLARGLSYYTGAIFEVKINNVAIGSVCGGGRYDNLTGVFGMPGISGTGISFGVDRICDAMEELHLFPKETIVSSRVLIASTDDESQRHGLHLLQKIRERGVAAEIFPDVAKLKKQLEYANRKVIPYVVIIGSEEITKGLFTVKNMETGTQESLTAEALMNLLSSQT